MKEKIKRIIAVIPCIWASTLFAGECGEVPPPPDLPQNPNTSYDDVIAAKNIVHSYQASSFAFRSCLNNEIRNLIDASNDTETPSSESQAQASSLLASFSESVRMEENLALGFRKLMRDYRSKKGFFN